MKRIYILLLVFLLINILFLVDEVRITYIINIIITGIVFVQFYLYYKRK